MWQLSYETYFTHHFTFANQIIVSTLNLNFVIDINETINKQWNQQDYLLWQAFRTEYLTDPHFETNGEDDDSFLLEFEKYVSEQDVSFFSQKMDISKIFLCVAVELELDILDLMHVSNTLFKLHIINIFI